MIREVIAAGAMAYIPKSSTAPASPTRAAARAGRRDLAARDPGRRRGPRGRPDGRAYRRADTQQRNILSLMAAGKPNKIIAYELGIAETTVKAHITLILRKLGVFSRTQAVLAARDLVSQAAVRSAGATAAPATGPGGRAC